MTAIPTLDTTDDSAAPLDTIADIDDLSGEHSVDEAADEAPADMTGDADAADDVTDVVTGDLGHDMDDSDDDADDDADGAPTDRDPRSFGPPSTPVPTLPATALLPVAPTPTATTPASTRQPISTKSTVPAPPPMPPRMNRPTALPGEALPTGAAAATTLAGASAATTTLRSGADSPSASRRTAPRERTTPSPRRTHSRPPVENPAFEGDKGSALNRLPRLPFELALLFAIALMLLATFAVVTKVSLTNALETNTSNEEQIAELTARQSATVAELDALRASADEPVEPTEPVVIDNSAELDELRSTLEDLETENAGLAADNDALRTELAAVPAPNVDEPAPTPTPTPESTPSFDRLLGEEMSAPGGSRLNALENECLGHFVIEDIGLEAIGAGLHTARTSSANDAVIASMLRGAEACAIDPSRIFRQ